MQNGEDAYADADADEDAEEDAEEDADDVAEAVFPAAVAMTDSMHKRSSMARAVVDRGLRGE